MWNGVWIVVYMYIMIITFMLVASDRFIEEKPAPLITSTLSALLWPLFVLWYAWKGIKRLQYQILKELSELHRG